MNKGRMGLSCGKLRLLCGAAAFCALLLGSTRVNAQAVFQPFSADQVHSILKKTTTGKVYATENAMRMEGEDPSLFEIPSGYQKIGIPGMSPPQP